jgi:membrane protease YdiL (CAAX protease family)
MIWLQHVLVFLILVGPVWDYYEFKRLKASTDPGAKVKFYKKILVAQWALSALVLLAVGRGIFWAPAKFAWMNSVVARSVGGGVLVGVALGLVLPFLALSKPKGRAAIRKAFAKMAFFVPTHAGQFSWFGALAITAGICEEWVFRGFLFRYFGETPWHLGLAAAFVISTVLFGVNHFYQGWTGILSTALIGAGLGLLYLWTGSLLAPMIVHALVDLRALALLKGAFRPDETTDGDSAVVPAVS